MGHRLRPTEPLELKSIYMLVLCLRYTLCWLCLLPLISRMCRLSAHWNSSNGFEICHSRNYWKDSFFVTVSISIAFCWFLLKSLILFNFCSLSQPLKHFFKILLKTTEDLLQFLKISQEAAHVLFVWSQTLQNCRLRSELLLSGAQNVPISDAQGWQHFDFLRWRYPWHTLYSEYLLSFSYTL